MGFGRSALEAEGREIGVGVERIDAFGLLQLRAGPVGERGHEHLDEHLEQPVGEHHGKECPGTPDAEEREWVEDQAVDALADEGRADEAQPEVAALRCLLYTSDAADE